jgi:signal transduction histidine kinase
VTRAAPAYNGAEADLDAYAAQAAHQLGEAVALLRGYLVVLEQRGERDPELGDALRGLSAGTERAQRFVDDLLDLAAAGRTEPAAELVSLHEALDTARRRLAAELQDAGAAVRAGSLPVVRADRELVARLLVHLLRVALSAGARNVAVEAADEDGVVRVEVRDDGTPAAGDAFAPFARARGRGPLVGAGVGLTVSRRLVELHGGTIALGQDADGTTLVTFTLPAERAHAGTMAMESTI